MVLGSALGCHEGLQPGDGSPDVSLVLMLPIPFVRGLSIRYKFGLGIAGPCWVSVPGLTFHVDTTIGLAETRSG
jgi:hypothetical protein